jgi:hypothetical protein
MGLVMGVIVFAIERVVVRGSRREIKRKKAA